MPRSRKKEPFYLVIIDHDNNIFNVVGPLSNINDWDRKIIDLRNTGRNVRRFTRSAASHSRDSLIRMISSDGKFRFSEQLIVEEPEDTSAEFTGHLPNYARNANRRRVVQVLCKGRCIMTRWAEMEVDYPGEKVLKSPDSHLFRARCLKCGYIAKDPYNWTR